MDEAQHALELGTIVDVNYEHEGPALLLDHIEEHPAGCAPVCAPTGPPAVGQDAPRASRSR